MEVLLCCPKCVFPAGLISIIFILLEISWLSFSSIDFREVYPVIGENKHLLVLLQPTAINKGSFHSEPLLHMVMTFNYLSLIINRPDLSKGIAPDLKMQLYCLTQVFFCAVIFNNLLVIGTIECEFASAKIVCECRILDEYPYKCPPVSRPHFYFASFGSTGKKEGCAVSRYFIFMSQFPGSFHGRCFLPVTAPHNYGYNKANKDSFFHHYRF